MQIRVWACFAVVVCAVGLAGCKELSSGGQQAGGTPGTSGTASAEGGKNCLQCHGPFDKLIASSTNYVAPSGEKTSPHRYVPHNSKEAADIPDCLKCHTAHPPKPAKGSIDLSKVSIDYCYKTCHHEKTLTSCKECHQ